MVVDTDYNNFVILYSCTEYLANALKFDYIWVLTRKPWDEKSKEWKVLYQQIEGILEEKMPLFKVSRLVPSK